MQPPPKPKPKIRGRRASIAVRMRPEDRARIKALAKTHKLSLQKLGEFAWSLALHEYGQPPLRSR